jgi:hypothetical protein
VYRSEVALAQADGDPVVIEARCSQCAQLVAPHLRFGTTDAPDETREAFCALVAPGDSALVYTGQDPASFAGADPSFEALLAATRTYCGCGAVTVSIQPTAVTLAPGDTQQFAATVLGSSNVDVTWTATSGTVDQDGFYFAPDEPGIYTVTATSVEDPTRSASAIVTIASGSSGVTRTDNRGQASVTNPTCDPAFRRSPEGATAWNDTISCESTVPGSQASGVATTMFSETYVGSDLVAVTASSSTSATGTEDRLACASGEYILLFSVAETTGVSIHAQVDGQPDSSTFFFGGPSITINDRDGHASVDQTATLTPGQYGVIITTLGCDGQGTTPPSSGSFSLNLVFGP